VAESAALLELRGVTKSFESVAGEEAALILRGIDLEVAAGESLAIVGPSGSGKSTLLHVIGGLTAPSSGQVLLEGRDLSQLDADALALVRNRAIGFVFQSHHLLPQCTALENVLVPTLAEKRSAESSAALTRRARDLLERVGLAARASHRPGQLSGGECQRVAVVRALIMGPKLLLADEPTGSLDGRAADGVAEIFSTLNREQGVSLIAVTHSDRFATRMSRVLELSEGRLK